MKIICVIIINMFKNGVQVVAGSNPVIPTSSLAQPGVLLRAFFCLKLMACKKQLTNHASGGAVASETKALKGNFPSG